MTALETTQTPLDAVSEDAARKDVRYGVRWSDGVILLGSGLVTQESAEKWFSWLRDVKFRPGIPSLVEAKSGYWVKVPLER